uniref:Uncharacterized protein n=1 Tax=Arundo donax TaxID=35708 RepID=A0A0A9DR31_ARUDO
MKARLAISPDPRRTSYIETKNSYQTDVEIHPKSRDNHSLVLYKQPPINCSIPQTPIHEQQVIEGWSRTKNSIVYRETKRVCTLLFS